MNADRDFGFRYMNGNRIWTLLAPQISNHPTMPVPPFTNIDTL